MIDTTAQSDWTIAVQSALSQIGIDVPEPEIFTVEEQDITISEVQAPDTEYPNVEDYSGLIMNNPIPENSKTITMEQSTSRFSGALWYDKVREKSIILAGLGGIGSYVAFLLSRMRPGNLTLYDPDKVEAVNMSGQLYTIADIGNTKTQAITDAIHLYSDYHSIFSYNSRYSLESRCEDIMICGFDNMRSRREFYTRWKEHITLSPGNERHCLFIDGRLAAEEFQILCIRGDDTYNMERYEREWLFDDTEADETLCSYKQTTFMANMIGSVITNLFVNFCANDLEGDEHPLIERDLPFLTTYDASMMIFTTEA